MYESSQRHPVWVPEININPCNSVWSVRAGGMDPPLRTKSHPAGSISSSHPGGPPCWASPLAFGLIGSGRSSSAPSFWQSSRWYITNVFNRWSSLTLMAGWLPHYFTRPMLSLWGGGGVALAWVGGANSCLPACRCDSSEQQQGMRERIDSI
jgi:hypothetical protein